MNGRLASYKRIVIKIGSALLVDRETGVRRTWLEGIANDIARISRQSGDVIVVSSGSIALGRRQMRRHESRLASKPLKLEESQAAAAIGQIALGRTWSEVLGNEGVDAGQILMTLGDTEERRRYLNVRDTINTLLKWKAVPIINENDTVATQEIRYGDNDRLAARVASMMSADLLVLLSDIDGLYTAPPQDDPSAELIEHVETITPEIMAMAGESASILSSGGMKTKIEAARIATMAGTEMVIASGKIDNPLKALDSGGTATWFKAADSPVNNRRKWIAGALETSGRVTIDDGAIKALRAGKSLLPAGVRKIHGSFHRGDTVQILAPEGQIIGRGLIEYDRDDAVRAMGKSSDELADLLGENYRSVMIHRDNLAME